MTFLAELRRRKWLLLLAGAVVVLFSARAVSTFYTDVLWFSSLELESVFWTLLGTRWALGSAAGLVVFALIAVNLSLVRRSAPAYRIPSQQEETIERYREALEPYARPLLLGVAVIIGVLSGVSMANEWQTALLFVHGEPVGEVDPQFGRDLGYFLFQLPFWELVNSWLFTSLLVTIVLTAVAHYLFGGIRPQAAGQKITPQVNAHVSVLLALIVAVRAWGFVLDQHLLSYSERGFIQGLGYTDVNAQLLAYQVLAIVAAAVALLFLANVALRTWLVPAGGLALLVVTGVVLAGLYPAGVQAFRVEPQERELESDYIARNMEWTRYGFALRNDADVSEVELAGEQGLEADQIVDNTPTFEALRLWDPAVLRRSFTQRQRVRRFYEFHDVNLARYTFDDETRQVMLSAREIDIGTLGDTSWENRRLIYTHGYGLVAADVNETTGTGDPVLLAGDMPQAGTDELVADNPRLYVSERPPLYSIVDTEFDEYDYPVQETGEEQRYRYTGADGVSISGPINRLAFALRFYDRNILLSGLLGADSRVLFNRSLTERLGEVAPFLELDHDPYPVVVDGEDTVKWIQDAYTLSDMLPYSTRVDLGALTMVEQRDFEVVPAAGQEGELELRETIVQRSGIDAEANYIRNSVKAVVDAYDGTVDLYVDEDEPLARAWQQAFPDLFTPMDEAPEELRAHFRHPEDMFRVQTAMFERYHVPTVAQFYQGEDAWEIPRDPASSEGGGNEEDAERQMRPHYMMLQVDGEEEPEFSLVQPYTPFDANILAGWLVARNDGDRLGELVAYRLPSSGVQRWGPGQFTGNIDSDGPLANLIGRWNDANASLIYGQTLLLPLGDSQVYAQPLFLQPDGPETLPKLTVVVVAQDDELAWSTSLGGALRELYGDDAPDIETGGLPPEEVLEDLQMPPQFEVEEPAEEDEAPTAEAPDIEDLEDVDPEVSSLITEALERFAAAEEALQEGDLAAYQSETREAERLVSEAQERMGEPDETAAADD